MAELASDEVEGGVDNRRPSPRPFTASVSVEKGEKAMWNLTAKTTLEEREALKRHGSPLARLYTCTHHIGQAFPILSENPRASVHGRV